MNAICKRCKKQDLAKYMTGFKNFYFCDKCENKGIVEEMLKDFEKQTKGKMSEKERVYNLKSFEKMLEKQNERMFNFIESEDEEIL